MAELADAADSKSAEVHPSWGFDPPSRHQPKFLKNQTLAGPRFYSETLTGQFLALRDDKPTLHCYDRIEVFGSPRVAFFEGPQNP